MLAGGVRIDGGGIDATAIADDGSDALFSCASPQEMSIQELSIDAGYQSEAIADAS